MKGCGPIEMRYTNTRIWLDGCIHTMTTRTWDKTEEEDEDEDAEEEEKEERKSSVVCSALAH